MTKKLILPDSAKRGVLLKVLPCEVSYRLKNRPGEHHLGVKPSRLKWIEDLRRELRRYL